MGCPQFFVVLTNKKRSPEACVIRFLVGVALTNSKIQMASLLAGE